MTPSEYSPTQFIKALGKIDNSKSNPEKFRDFCEMAYCAYAKITACDEERANKLESRYMEIVGTYRDKDDVRKYPELLSFVVMGVQDGLDYLGDVSGQLEVLNARQGQFFTPMSVCRLMAEVTLDKDFIQERIASNGYFTCYEPAAGSGNMVLCASDVPSNLGFNRNHHMLTYAADLSQLAFWMCYIQLSARGIPAFVARENSLSMERFDGAWTPASLYFADYHGHLDFNKPSKPKPEMEDIPALPEPTPEKLRQLSMF